MLLCCVATVSFSFIEQEAAVFVGVRARVCTSVCKWLHPLEISIEKVTPLHSARRYTLHILFIWVLVCQWDTRSTRHEGELLLSWWEMNSAFQGVFSQIVFCSSGVFHLHQAKYDTVLCRRFAALIDRFFLFIFFTGRSD